MNPSGKEDRSNRILSADKVELVRTIAQWNERRFGKLILNSARFLASLESPSDDNARPTEFARNAMAELAPIPIGMIESPLRTIVESLRTTSYAIPEKLHNAIVWLFRRSGSELNAEDLLGILQLLVKIEITDAELIANLALQRIIDARSIENERDSISETLVYLCGSNGGTHACLIMVQSLREKGLASRVTAEAALRIVATTEPSQLALAIRSLGAYFEDEADGDLIGLTYVLEDVLARAKPIGLLTALTALRPQEHRFFLRATFGRSRDGALFMLQRDAAIGEHPRSLIAARGRERFRLADYFLPGIGRLSVEEWVLSLLKTLDFLPVRVSPEKAATKHERVAFSQTEDVEQSGPLERAADERLRSRNANS